MADEPRFLTRNFVDEFAVATLVNAGPVTATVPRLFDRDRELLFKTSGANSDAVTVDVSFQFRGAGVPVNRTIDTLVLLNHNLASLDFERWDGAAFVAIPGGSFSGLTTGTLVFTFASLSTERVRVRLKATRTANQEKEVGELLAMGTLFAFPADDGLESFSPEHRPVAVVTSMADGGVLVNQLRWAGNRVDRFRARVGFRLLSKTNLDNLLAIVRRGEFTAQLEPTQRPEEFFLVTAVPGGFPHGYTSPGYKAPGYYLSLELAEV